MSTPGVGRSIFRQDSVREPTAWSRPCEDDDCDEPLLGVSVSYLQEEFLEEMESHFGTGADPSFNDICKHGLLCHPSSYVDALHPPHVGQANVMLSWCWESTVRTVADSLMLWCLKAKLDPDGVFVWVHALCTKQEQETWSEQPLPGLGPAAGNGEPGYSALEMILAFRKRLQRIHIFLVLMSPLQSPLGFHSTWGILELFAASRSSQCVIHMLLSSADEDAFEKALMGTSELSPCISYALEKSFDLVTNVNMWNSSSIAFGMKGILHLFPADSEALGLLASMQDNRHLVDLDDLGSEPDSSVDETWLCGGSTHETLVMPIDARNTNLETELKIISHLVAEALKQWFFDKAQAVLQGLVARQEHVPAEAFANVGSLLRRDSKFAPLGFLVLQQGLHFVQATGQTHTASYALLLLEMGKCFQSQGRRQQAFSFFVLARDVYDEAEIKPSSEAALLFEGVGLTCPKEAPITTTNTTKSRLLTDHCAPPDLLACRGTHIHIRHLENDSAAYISQECRQDGNAQSKAPRRPSEPQPYPNGPCGGNSSASAAMVLDPTSREDAEYSDFPAEFLEPIPHERGLDEIRSQNVPMRHPIPGEDGANDICSMENVLMTPYKQTEPSLLSSSHAARCSKIECEARLQSLRSQGAAALLDKSQRSDNAASGLLGSLRTWSTDLVASMKSVSAKMYMCGPHEEDMPLETTYCKVYADPEYAEFGVSPSFGLTQQDNVFKGRSAGFQSASL